jgi:uncharacterized protein (DUF1800 family)
MASFRPTSRLALAIILALSLALTGQTSAEGVWVEPGDERAVAHTLNRLAFGPRPGDIDRIAKAGLAAWIDAQLQPQRIANDDVERRLAALTTLTLDARTIAREYVAPARQERRRRQQANPQGSNSVGDAGGTTSMNGALGRPGQDRELSDAMRRERQIFAELAEAKLLRAVYSERQLEEVLVDFWFNHFNVFARKGRTEIYVGEYEREAIRPHVLGRFRDLLGATAKSPAMLVYLDNWMSVDPKAVAAVNDGRRGRFAIRGPSGRSGANQQPAGGGSERRNPTLDTVPPQRQARGLNENYARELLELHTLGVDGGYTQQDVVEVARAFTGWTIGRPGEGGFRFAATLHDRAAKTVLGQTIPAGGGVDDGERVLDILARHPSTARHIAQQLAQRFVSDTPPASVVDRAAAAFQKTNGDLREVVRAIVTAPEFFAPEARRAKVKTPLEFVASALRATGAEIRVATPLVRVLAGLGMPLYLCQPPTGYHDAADGWVSSGALVNRMNFALAMSSGQLRGIEIPIDRGTTAALSTRVLRDALNNDVSEATMATIAKASTSAQALALAIGSPEFQRQ